MTRGATLFSGGGGVESLLKQHINFVHAVEYDPAIAAVYRANHGDHIQVADVCDVDYATWGALDYLHASPVCKEFSQAKTGGIEGNTDINTALAVVRCIEQTQPRVFTLENVGQYQHSKSFKLICRALDLAGYMWHAEVLNSANFGVPQTRRRLILRAVKDALLPGLAAPDPWVGWYAAIEDLIPTLPPSQFAPWQLARLPEELSGSLVFCNNDPEWGLPYKYADAPMPSITTQIGGRTRAFLVNNHFGDPSGASVNVKSSNEPAHMVAPINPMRAILMRGDNMHQEWGKGYRDADEPAMTTRPGRKPRAWLVPDQNNGNGRGQWAREAAQPSMTLGSTGSARAWLSAGRVVRMTPRALARFQSLPDSFVLPDKASLACQIIGNAVPSLMMQKIVEPLL